MAQRSKRFSVSMTNELYEALEKASADAGQDMARVVRDAIATYLTDRFGIEVEDPHPKRGGDMKRKS